MNFLWTRSRSHSDSSESTSLTGATNPIPADVSRKGKALNKNAATLNKTIGKLGRWNIPVFNHKVATRKAAETTQSSIQSLDNKSIEQLVVKKRTSGILQSFEKVIATYNRLYPEKGSKTEQSVAQVLTESSRIQVVEEEVKSLIRLYDNPNVETLFKALVLENVEKPDLSSISPRTRAERIVKWLVLNQDELALLETLEIPSHLILHNIPIEFFDFLRNLRTLNIPDNRLNSLPENLLIKCPLLTTIDVTGNFITTIPPSLTHLIDINMQTQRICNHNIIEIFNCLDIEASDKPRFGAVQAENSIILEDWLSENKGLLKSVKTLNIPLGSSIENLPIRIFRCFSNLTELNCPGGKLRHLPEELRAACPKLNKINVEKNYLSSVPASLSDLVDLNVQPQRTPLIDDSNTRIFFKSIALSDKPAETASLDEQEVWLLKNLQELKNVFRIEVPMDSHLTTFPECILQYLPNLTSISCIFGKLNSFPTNLLILCPKLEMIEVYGNSLTADSIPETLKTLVNLETQKQRLPMIYDSNSEILLHILCGLIPNESDEEKTNRLHESRPRLANIQNLVIPSHSSISEFPPCILQYLPNLRSITCLFGDIRILSKDLLQLCPKLESLNMTGNWISAIPLEYARFEGLKEQKQKVTLEFRDCVEELPNHQITNIVTRLSNYAIALEDGMSTKTPKEAKEKIRKEATALLENPTYKSLSEKNILHRISEDPQSFRALLDAISDIIVKKNQLVEKKFFKETGRTLPLANSLSSSLKTLHGKISVLQRSFEVLSNPTTFKDIETLVEHLLKTPNSLLFRGKGQTQKEDGVIMTSFLEKHRGSLDNFTSLNVSNLNLSTCPKDFIKEYLKQVSAIQCNEAQVSLFQSFAIENGIYLSCVDDSDGPITF